MKVGEFVGKYHIIPRTGADRRLIDDNAQQKVVGFISVGRSQVKKSYRRNISDSFTAQCFVFFDTEGRPRGFVNGWQDARAAIEMIEKMQIVRSFDKHGLRKMKLLMDL